MERKLFEGFDKTLNFALYYEKLFDNTYRYVYFKSYSIGLRWLIAPPKAGLSVVRIHSGTPIKTILFKSGLYIYKEGL